MKKLFILLFYPLSLFAIGTPNDGYVVMRGTTERINVHSTCKKVKNSHVSNDYYVPTKTSPEWTSFVNNPPANVINTNCEATYRSCLDILRANSSSTSGKYTIDPDGVGVGYPAFDTYCDMDNDGGGWTLVWSNTRGGTNKPFTDLDWYTSTNTTAKCSQANGAGTGCGTYLNGNKETFNYYIGLNYWNKIAQQNSNLEIRQEWRPDYLAPTINQSAKWNIKKFSPSQLYLLTSSNYVAITGSRIPGFYSDSSGFYFSSLDLDNDLYGTSCAGEFYSPYWSDSCSGGRFTGTGEFAYYDYYNASHYIGNQTYFGDATGAGGGNGWIFIREYDYQANCTEIKSKSRNTPSGLYWIDPDGVGGNNPIMVQCDMTTDGGGWTLVFNHKSDTGGYFTNSTQAQTYNVANPMADRYSILYGLENFRSIKGNFTFKINWPGFSHRNIWQQLTNPIVDPAIKGYVPITIDSSSEMWGGLEQNCANCTNALMDGSVGNTEFKYAVGTYSSYTANGGQGIPASTTVKGLDQGVPQTQLWVRDDSFSTIEPRDCQDIFENGESLGNGTYRVDPKSNGTFMQVYCDMTSDGGGWTLVFNHNVAGGYFASYTDVSSKNPGTPSANLYSILDQLNDFKANGRYLFKMNWPTYNQRNIWAQTSNPTDDVAVSGYVGISIDSTTDSWGGLERNCNKGCTSSYMDGSVDNADTFYSVGTYTAFGSPAGIKSSTTIALGTEGVPQVQLWTRRSEGQHTKRSCKEILLAGLSTGDGFYLIDPDGVGGSYHPVRVYCDMTRSGGGWTRVVVSNGASSMASDYFVKTYERGLIGINVPVNKAASINPEQFSKLVGTTDAMLVASDYAGSPFIESSMGVWSYDVAKCSGTLLHTSRVAGCAGQTANINYSTTHKFNISFLAGAQGISPSSTPRCTGFGSCNFEFYLR